MSAGLYGKYRVEKNTTPGVFGGHYFVLDPLHDPHAIPALRTYIEACRDDNPQLASDLTAWIERTAS